MGGAQCVATAKCRAIAQGLPHLMFQVWSGGQGRAWHNTGWLGCVRAPGWVRRLSTSRQDLPADFAVGCIARVHVGVGDACAHRLKQLGNFRCGDALYSWSDHITCLDYASHCSGRSGARLGSWWDRDTGWREICQIRAQENTYPAADPGLAEMDMRFLRAAFQPLVA